jgi:hypothetical protein
MHCAHLYLNRLIRRPRIRAKVIRAVLCWILVVNRWELCHTDTVSQLPHLRFRQILLIYMVV